jgi:hypothetical protein
LKLKDSNYEPASPAVDLCSDARNQYGRCENKSDTPDPRQHAHQERASHPTSDVQGNEREKDEGDVLREEGNEFGTFELLDGARDYEDENSANDDQNESESPDPPRQ